VICTARCPHRERVRCRGGKGKGVTNRLTYPRENVGGLRAMHSDAITTSRGKELVPMNPDALSIHCAVQPLHAKFELYRSGKILVATGLPKRMVPSHISIYFPSMLAPARMSASDTDSLFLESQSLQGDGVCMPHHSRSSILQAIQLWQYLITCPIHLRPVPPLFKDSRMCDRTSWTLLMLSILTLSSEAFKRLSSCK